MLDNIKQNLTVFLLLIFLFGCNNSQEQSFNQLSRAFLDWYYKNYPIIGSENGIHLYDHLFPDYNQNLILNNLDDINRFIIELDQIDQNKLSAELKMNYFTLSNEMARLKFEYSDIKVFEQSPTFYLKKINKSIENINYSSNSSFDNYISRLSFFKKTLDDAKVNIKNKRFKILNDDLFKNISLHLDRKYAFYESKNISIDTLDYYNNIAIESLNSFEKWLNIEYTSDVVKTLTLDKFSKKLSFYYQEKNIFNEKEALQDIDKLYKKMFSISLPIFLLKNDEPVWISRNDTLDVIKFSLVEYSNKEIINHLDYIEENIPKLKKDIENNHVVNINNFRNFNIKLLNNYNHDYELLSTDLPGDFNTNKYLHLNINHFSNDFDIDKIDYFQNKFSKINIDLELIEKVLLGEYYLSLVDTKKSMIDKTFKKEMFIKGWGKYIQETFVSNIYDYGKEYRLFQYHELIKSIINYIVDYKLNIGLIDKQEAIDFMVKNGFYPKYEAERVISYILSEPGISSLEYLGYKQIKNIEKEYKKKQGSRFNLKKFNTMLILSSNMNFKNIKEKILK